MIIVRVGKKYTDSAEFYVEQKVCPCFDWIGLSKLGFTRLVSVKFPLKSRKSCVYGALTFDTLLRFKELYWVVIPKRGDNITLKRRICAPTLEEAKGEVLANTPFNIKNGTV